MKPSWSARKARPQQQGTSLDALIQSYLKTYAGDDGSGTKAIRNLLDLSRNAKSGSGGRRWTRDELHAR